MAGAIAVTAACGDPSPPSVEAVPSPISTALRCASGYSGGGTPDYERGGGELAAAAAMGRLANLIRQGRPHVVSATDDEMTTVWLDDTGSVVARGTVRKANTKWQIADWEQCAVVEQAAALREQSGR